MRVVLWAAYAEAEIRARLTALLGESLTVVSNFNGFADAIADADALLCQDFVYSAKMAATINERAGRLRWLQLLTAGYENAQANGVRPGVTVTNASPAYAPGVAVHAVTMLLALHRRLPVMQANQARHEWNRAVAAAITTPIGSTVAVLGFGSIGQEIARLLRPFGAHIIALTRHAKSQALADESLSIEKLHEVLPRADAIVLALPLDPATRHLIGASEFALCRKGALLINVSRGAIVETDALLAALNSGTLGGAGLDVTDPEPLPANHPLWAAPNLIISPHLAGADGKAGFERLAEVAAKNMERFLAGKPLEHVISL